MIWPPGGAQFLHHLLGFCQHIYPGAKGGKSLFRPGNGLEQQVHWRAVLQCLHLRGNVGEYADLCGDLQPVLYIVKQIQNSSRALYCVNGRVQPDDCVADAVAESLQQRGGHPGHIVGGVVGLQPAGKGARGADGGVAVGSDLQFASGVHQVQVAH